VKDYKEVKETFFTANLFQLQIRIKNLY